MRAVFTIGHPAGIATHPATDLIGAIATDLAKDQTDRAHGVSIGDEVRVGVETYRVVVASQAPSGTWRVTAVTSDMYGVIRSAEDHAAMSGRPVR